MISYAINYGVCEFLEHACTFSGSKYSGSKYLLLCFLVGSLACSCEPNGLLPLLNSTTWLLASHPSHCLRHLYANDINVTCRLQCHTTWECEQEYSRALMCLTTIETREDFGRNTLIDLLEISWPAPLFGGKVCTSWLVSVWEQSEWKAPVGLWI